MIDISVSQLVKGFEVGSKILDELTFQVQQGERVGLLGQNGCGKTTLLRILTGELEPDEGSVSIAAGKRVGLISQIPIYPNGATVEAVLDTAFAPLHEMQDKLLALTKQLENGGDKQLLGQYDSLAAAFQGAGGYEMETEKNKVCNGLSIPPQMRQRQFAHLSGGEKTRINLARMILENTDILLLDEPTNHLDLRATQWLEEYLSRFKGTVLTVSHDRYFLDRVVSRVVEISAGKAEFYAGNYSFYAVEKEQRYLERLKQYEKEQAKVAQLQKAADQLHLWAFMGNDKLHKRAFSMQRRIERMQTVDKPRAARKMQAQFAQKEFHGDEVLTLHKVEKSFSGRKLFSEVSLAVRGGERIALLGDNGTGKSTLLKIILGEQLPDSGTLRQGPTVKIGYLPQIIHFNHPERTLLDTMIYDLDCTAQQARDRLAAFQFRGEDVFKPVSALSGGEQSRLRLCMLMGASINLLVLDEPTNHLDIQSREWIEEAVEEFSENLLFVSHDRYFISRFATRIWMLEDGGMLDFEGNYQQFQAFLEKRRAQPPTQQEKVQAKEKKDKPKRTGGTKLLEKELAAAERAVSRAEQQQQELEQEIERAASDYQKLQELYQKREDLEQQLLALYDTWEQAAAQLEEVREK